MSLSDPWCTIYLEPSSLPYLISEFLLTEDMFGSPEDGWQGPGPAGSTGEGDSLPQHDHLLPRVEVQSVRGKDELQLERGVSGRNQGGVGGFAGDYLVSEAPGDTGHAQLVDSLATTGGTRKIRMMIRDLAW